MVEGSGEINRWIGEDRSRNDQVTRSEPSLHEHLASREQPGLSIAKFKGFGEKSAGDSLTPQFARRYAPVDLFEQLRDLNPLSCQLHTE